MVLEFGFLLWDINAHDDLLYKLGSRSIPTLRGLNLMQNLCLGFLEHSDIKKVGSLSFFLLNQLPFLLHKIELIKNLCRTEKPFLLFLELWYIIF